MELFEPKKRIIVLLVPKMSKFQKCPSSKNVQVPKMSFFQKCLFSKMSEEIVETVA
jgi:hypothetical protein